MFKSKLFFLLCFFLSISAVKANTDNDLRRADKLLLNKNYGESFHLYQRLAKENEVPRAQFSLALFYDYGWGQNKDVKNACKWYKKAAKNAIPAAADAYAECLVKGSLGSVDFTEAALWYSKAAELGLYYSYCRLGDLYINGQGVEKNTSKGLGLCKKAAKQGSVPAMLHLGEYFLKAKTVLSNKSALHWFTTAASYRSAEADYKLGLIHDSLTLYKDHYAALHWFEKSASKGHEPAYLPTATLYFNAPKDLHSGFLSETNLAKAYLWLSASNNVLLTEKQKILTQNMLNEVLAVMPQSWIKDLDNKVKSHLNRFPPSVSLQ